MCNLTNFNFDNNQVRTLLINDKPYFVGYDVAEALGYSKPRNAISTHCKGALKQGVLTEGGKQEMLVIPEGDVFRLIIKSRLEKAQKFESWVMDEVLPQLRKTGKYEIADTGKNCHSQVVSKKEITQDQPDDKGFYLYHLTCAVSPSKLRYKIIDGTIYFKTSDIDSILEISRFDGRSDSRTDTNYSIHNVLYDIGIATYDVDYLLNIWQILELCNHIKTKRAELLENILMYKVKPYFERKITTRRNNNVLTA